MVDERDQAYLDETSRPDNCEAIVQLLGWRLVDPGPEGVIARTAASLCERTGPLFVERHMILGRGGEQADAAPESEIE
jgi:hypothetical protein